MKVNCECFLLNSDDGHRLHTRPNDFVGRGRGLNHRKRLHRKHVISNK